jgi:hypothetical protein
MFKPVMFFVSYRLLLITPSPWVYLVTIFQTHVHQKNGIEKAWGEID